MLGPQTPQQGGAHVCQQLPSSDSSTDGGLASDGSMSSCGTPGPPMLCHPQQAMHDPFYWQHGDVPSPRRAMPPSPMAYPYMGLPPGALAHGVMQHHPMQQGYMMPAHGAMPLPGMPSPGMPPPAPMHCAAPQSPMMTPQRPPTHGGMAHGLPPLATPATPHFHCMQPQSPAYGWQPGTPCQWQEPGEQYPLRGPTS